MKKPVVAFLLLFAISAVAALGRVEARAGLTLSKHVLSRQNAAARWTFRYEVPVLSGTSKSERAFNDAMQKRAERAFAAFQRERRSYPPTKGVPGRSESSVRYEVLTRTDNCLGLRFTNTVFWIGGAHPYSECNSVNWLSDGTFVTLEQMFTPSSRYLDTLSRLSRAQLEQRLRKDGLEVFEDGIGPRAKNFQAIVATKKGLVITFGQAQAAASVAGPLSVVIPWSEVEPMLSPLGKRLQQAM